VTVQRSDLVRGMASACVRVRVRIRFRISFADSCDYAEGVREENQIDERREEVYEGKNQKSSIV